MRGKILHRRSFSLNQKSSGFSLIELIVVIGLISVTAGIVGPVMSTMLPNMRLKTAANDLYSSVMSTRIKAVKKNTKAAIVFTPVSNSYHVCFSPGADNNWTTLADNSVDDSINLDTYKGGVRFGHGSVSGSNALDGGSFPADGVDYTVINNVLEISPDGTLSSGYVYLQNTLDNEAVYAVGSIMSGAILKRRWRGGGWE